MIPWDKPIAVVAPCGVFNPTRLEAGLAWLREQGLDARPFEGLQRPFRYLAGDDEHRLQQLGRALTEPGWGAVWVARGGYGLTRLLHRLPEDLPPRPVIGFSDVTALFCALHRRSAGPLVHAPVVHSLPITDEASKGWLLDLLRGAPLPPLAGEVLVPGEAEGPLIGGNLALLAALCGTPDQLDARGSILVVEEVSEAPYRIDRMLQQLRSAGVLDGLAGVALGTFTGCGTPEGANWTLNDVLLDHLGSLGVPVLADLPIGHGAENRAFVWGRTARIERGTLRVG